jgi:hypothetical protein
VVEIIRKGELPGEKIYETTCTNCKTRFRFKKKEARFSSDQRDGNALIIRCPLEGCNNDCWVTTNEQTKYHDPREPYDGWYPGR